MTLPDMLMIDGVEYRRADRDEPEKAKDPTEGHSPLPWTGDVDEGYIIGAGEHTLDICNVSNGTGRPWPANFALILRAVNHYEELMAFVERVSGVDHNNETFVNLADKARKLLAKVRGS